LQKTLADHLFVAWLKDMQCHRGPGEEHDFERE
jgi:hypothetical protein